MIASVLIMCVVCGRPYMMCVCGYLRWGVWMESGVRACVKYILIQQSKLFKHVKVMFYAISSSEICAYCCPVIY